jgi:glycerol-3-phosphate dehydrogenase (NAD(P)+)
LTPPRRLAKLSTKPAAGHMRMAAIGRIAILGAGAWGTALAVVARRAGRDVVLQVREAEVAAAIARDHENPVFLPGVPLDPEIRTTLTPREAIAGAEAVLLAVPAQHLRAVLAQARAAWPVGAAAIICAKGIEQRSGALLSTVVAEELPGVPAAVLSGPSFAIEVARGLPAAVTFACADSVIREALPAALGGPEFRIYSTDDVVGAELGGAVKNVLAIACGIVAGRGMGDNARAALITRGLAEMARLARVHGARPETLMGLSGLGDLVLTCSAPQSRNFSFGFALGEGAQAADLLAERTSVVEGVATASAVARLAGAAGVDMPIVAAVDAVLNLGADLDATIRALLARPFRAEGWAGR